MQCRVEAILGDIESRPDSRLQETIQRCYEENQEPQKDGTNVCIKLSANELLCVGSAALVGELPNSPLDPCYGPC